MNIILSQALKYRGSLASMLLWNLNILSVKAAGSFFIPLRLRHQKTPTPCRPRSAAPSSAGPSPAALSQHHPVTPERSRAQESPLWKDCESLGTAVYTRLDRTPPPPPCVLDWVSEGLGAPSLGVPVNVDDFRMTCVNVTDCKTFQRKF